MSLHTHAGVHAYDSAAGMGFHSLHGVQHCVVNQLAQALVIDMHFNCEEIAGLRQDLNACLVRGSTMHQMLIPDT